MAKVKSDPELGDDIPELTAEERVAFRQQMADKAAAAEQAAAEAQAAEEAVAAATAAVQAALEAAEKVAAEAAAAAAAQKEARKAAPRHFCGLLVEGLVEPDYIDNPDGDKRERTLTVSGTVYEHVSEDSDGVWVYKHLG